jgi:hypothetical protein
MVLLIASVLIVVATVALLQLRLDRGRCRDSDEGTREVEGEYKSKRRNALEGVLLSCKYDDDDIDIGEYEAMDWNSCNSHVLMHKGFSSPTVVAAASVAAYENSRLMVVPNEGAFKSVGEPGSDAIVEGLLKKHSNIVFEIFCVTGTVASAPNSIEPRCSALISIALISGLGNWKWRGSTSG